MKRGLCLLFVVTNGRDLRRSLNFNRLCFSAYVINLSTTVFIGLSVRIPLPIRVSRPLERAAASLNVCLPTFRNH